jgi:hypothetical protein
LHSGAAARFKNTMNLHLSCPKKMWSKMQGSEPIFMAEPLQRVR